MLPIGLRELLPDHEVVTASYAGLSGIPNGHSRRPPVVMARLEPYPGVWLQGVGEYGENGGTKRAAVAIGPQFGTVGPELVKVSAA